jgi:hypothetical protein
LRAEYTKLLSAVIIVNILVFQMCHTVQIKSWAFRTSEKKTLIKTYTNPVQKPNVIHLHAPKRQKFTPPI